MVEAYKKFWKNAFTIKGRMSRADFWWAYLANILASGVIGFVIGFIGGLLGDAGATITSLLMSAYFIVFAIAALTAEIRRLHDTNKSGWYLLVSMIPAVGSIILLVFLCGAAVEPNKYGPQL